MNPGEAKRAIQAAPAAFVALPLAGAAQRRSRSENVPVKGNIVFPPAIDWTLMHGTVGLVEIIHSHG
jgi:hypothetical protein